MTDTITKRVACLLLPVLHHGIGPHDMSPEALAIGTAQRILAAIREPTEEMIAAGDKAAHLIAGNRSRAAASYMAMIDFALAEGVG